MSSAVHMGKVDPAEKWRASLVLPGNEVDGSSGELIVAGLHSLASQRPGVLDFLFAHSAPARFLGGIVFVGRKAVQHAPRSKLFLELWILGIVRVFGIFFRIEVIQV